MIDYFLFAGLVLWNIKSWSEAIKLKKQTEGARFSLYGIPLILWVAWPLAMIVVACLCPDGLGIKTLNLSGLLLGLFADWYKIWLPCTPSKVTTYSSNQGKAE